MPDGWRLAGLLFRSLKISVKVSSSSFCLSMRMLPFRIRVVVDSFEAALNLLSVAGKMIKWPGSGDSVWVVEMVASEPTL